MPFGLQPGELALIFLILLLILGPTKLPALARGLGQAIREFRKAASGVEEAKEEASRAFREVEETGRISESRVRSKDIDDETLKRLAAKLGVETDRKSKDQLVNEIVARAKEKGLLDE
ncbi:MAG: twin-arginine translocase TatA/TatE family subunit [Desulfurococcales archaeon]|nr:twin-arginine translocase TatA/TatE family subunit [Desulfurococcales archaeon]